MNYIIAALVGVGILVFVAFPTHFLLNQILGLTVSLPQIYATFLVLGMLKTKFGGDSEENAIIAENWFEILMQCALTSLTTLVFLWVIKNFFM